MRSFLSDGRSDRSSAGLESIGKEDVSLDIKGERFVSAGGDTEEREFVSEGFGVKKSFSVTRDESGMLGSEDFD